MRSSKQHGDHLLEEMLRIAASMDHMRRALLRRGEQGSNALLVGEARLVRRTKHPVGDKRRS